MKTIVLLAIGIILLVIMMLSKGKKALSYKFFAGQHGERAVDSELRRLGSEYTVLDDLMLKDGGFTCQIDHVVLSPYGIFVIETKNFSGMVTGDDNWKEWYWKSKGTQKTVYSPVLQNIRHRDVLSKILGLKDVFFIPVIVFAGTAHIRINTSQAVIFLSQLVPFIQIFTRENLSETHVKRCTAILQQSNITDKNAREQHIRNIKRKRL